MMHLNQKTKHMEVVAVFITSGVLQTHQLIRYKHLVPQINRNETMWEENHFIFWGQVLHRNISFRSVNSLKHFPQFCCDEAPEPKN